MELLFLNSTTTHPALLLVREQLPYLFLPSALSYYFYVSSPVFIKQLTI